MNVVVAGWADDKRLAAQRDHALHPLRLLASVLAVEVRQLADVVDFAVPLHAAKLTGVGQQSLDHIGVVADEPEVPQTILQ